MKLIILDRDGVINEDSDDYIKSPEEWVAVPGSLEAISRLNQAGYHVVVATNQSGIARGYYDIDMLHRIHAKMNQELAQVGGLIEAVFFCPHGPDEGCECRKPKAGLLKQIAERYHTELRGVPCVGDSLRDLQAARAAGAEPILLRTGKGERTLEQAEGVQGVPVYDDLAEFVEALLAGQDQQ